MIDLNTIRRDVSKAYGSFEEPNFAFVSEAIANQPYRHLLAALSTIFSITVDMDPNYDVGWLFNLDGPNGEPVGLWLSMVGPYAVLIRTIGQNQYTIVEPATPTTQNERNVLDMLEKFGVHALDRKTLEAPIHLALFNAAPENVRFFQALFTDTDVLPWEDFTPPGQ